jgi:anaerobic selenocysteine-containing dehydrogenase
MLTFAPRAYEVPAVDAYSLRLVASRKLYDLGTLVQHSPSLAALAAGTGARFNPLDFDRLGVQPGATVKLTSARGSVSATATPDPGVPRGAVAMLVNQPGISVSALIDATAAVTEIRVEPS